MKRTKKNFVCIISYSARQNFEVLRLYKEKIINYIKKDKVINYGTTKSSSKQYENKNINKAINHMNILVLKIRSSTRAFLDKMIKITPRT